MHKVVKRGLSTILAFGLIGVGVVAGTGSSHAAPQQDETELVRTVSDIGAPNTYVLSADHSKMYTFNADGTAGRQISIPEMTIDGYAPSITSHVPFGVNSSITIASGDYYVAPTDDGYALLDLTHNQQSYYAVDVAAELGHDDEITAYFVSEAGAVTAFTASGAFLTLNQEHITHSVSLAEDPIDNNDVWIATSGVSADGALFYFTVQKFDDTADFPITSTKIIDARSGNVLRTFPPFAEGVFQGTSFDVSGEVIWGETYDANGDLTGLSGYSIATGALEHTFPYTSVSQSLWMADAANDSIVSLEGWAYVGRDLIDQSISGSRELRLGMLPTQIPGTRDLVFIDGELEHAGIVIGEDITNPVNADIAALDETVEFSAPARGLALVEDDEWLAETAPVGSIWQSSTNGSDWTDLPGETGTTLRVKVTADNYNTQYRRHFNDGFWGRADSAAARAVGPAPQITRADDLPNATVDSKYPAEFITAIGQDDLSWTLEDPATRAVSVGLPAGMVLDTTTGAISGTPTSAGEYEFTVVVSDLFGTDARQFHLTVASADVDPSKPDPEKPEPVVPTKPTPPNTGGTLANTGSAPISSALTLTALLAAAGAGIIALARRKRRAQS